MELIFADDVFLPTPFNPSSRDIGDFDMQVFGEEQEIDEQGDRRNPVWTAFLKLLKAKYPVTASIIIWRRNTSIRIHAVLVLGVQACLDTSAV
jgi:hypothetical protein